MRVVVSRRTGAGSAGQEEGRCHGTLRATALRSDHSDPAPPSEGCLQRLAYLPPQAAAPGPAVPPRPLAGCSACGLWGQRRGEKVLGLAGAPRS